MDLKVSNRGGHNKQAVGTHGYVDEVDEDRLICAAAIKYQKLAGIETIDVTPGRCSTNVDLAYGVNKANAANVDLFISHHLNATPGGFGVEVCYLSAKGKVYADRICAKISALGFKNRGSKLRKNLYELNQAHAPAIIIESFFVDCKSDVDLYHKLGADAIGKAIAEGILGHSIATKTVTSTVTAKVSSYTPVKLGEVTATTLNQRDHANASSAIVSTFKKGDIVHVYGLVDGFYSVVEHKIGKWISAEYVKDITPKVTPVVKPVVAPTGQLYKVQTGAFSSKTNAENETERLEKLGIETTIKLV